MNIWITKRLNILVYLGNKSVALYVAEISVELSVKEILVTPRVANFQGYMNSICFVATSMLAKLL